MLEGMQKAAVAVQSWASSVGSSISSVSKSSGLSSLMTAIVSPMMAIKDMALGAIMGQVGSLKDKYKELSGEIVESSRWAARLGTSTEDMMALEGAVGGAVGGVENLHKVLGKFRQNSVGDLVTEFAKFSDEIMSLPNSTERARRAVEMMGKSGIMALNVLEQGGDSLLKKMQQMKAIGFTVSDADAAKIEAANGGLKRMGMAVQGIYNQMLVGMAPAISYVSDLFMSMAPYINYIGKSLGAIVDVYFKAWVGVMGELGTQVMSAGSEILKAFGYSQDWFSKFPGWGEVAKSAMYVIAVGIANVWDVMKISIGKIMEYSFGMLRAVGRAGQVMGLGWGEKMEEVGIRWMTMGEKLQDNFGKTKIAVDKIFIGMAKNSTDTTKKMRDDLDSIYNYSPNNAMLKGSKEALSIEANWKTAQLAGKDPITGLAERQLAKLDNIEKGINKLVDKPVGNLEFETI